MQKFFDIHKRYQGKAFKVWPKQARKGFKTSCVTRACQFVGAAEDVGEVFAEAAAGELVVAETIKIKIWW